MNHIPESDKADSQAKAREFNNATSSKQNTAPRARSWSELWRLLNTTLVRDAVRGNLTGALDVSRMIAGAGFSESVTAFLLHLMRKQIVYPLDWDLLF